MSDRLLYVPPYIWNGGSFELALEFPMGVEGLLQSALTALWQHRDLDGCFLDQRREPRDQPRVPPHVNEERPHLLGLIQLPNGEHVACETSIIWDMGDSDWVLLCIPMGALGDVYRVRGYPFGAEGDRAGPWLRDVEACLVDIGRAVFAAAPFLVGLVGHEVAADSSAAAIAQEGIPAKRWFGYLRPHNGTLEYHAITAVRDS